MIDGLKPYPKYKDSGVPWLGEIPEHWGVRRLQQVALLLVSNVDKHKKEGEIEVRLCNYVDVYKNERITSDIKFMRATASPDEIRRYRLRCGDVAITKDSEIWNDIGVPALVEYEAPDLVYGYHLAILRPYRNQLGGLYLLRALQSQGVATQLHVAANGVTRFGLSHNSIKNAQILLPPLSEQTAVVRFLDWTDHRIRRVIRAREKRIKLLEEYKQALINQIVTGKIDVRTGKPYPKYKDSSVPWLGEVPEHWEVRRIKQMSLILRGKFSHRPRSDPSLYGGPYPFIQTGDVARAAKTITAYTQTLNDFGFNISKMFPAGTLVMTIAANIGDVAILEFEACFPDSIVGFIPRGNIQRDYLYYLFRGMKSELLREAPVNTQGNLNIDRIGSMIIPVPSIDEQQAIVHDIEENAQKIDTAIFATRREIELLKEFRTRLIADVVTGQLDVREAAAKLPDKAPGEKTLEGDEVESATGDSVVSGKHVDRTQEEINAG